MTGLNKLYTIEVNYWGDEKEIDKKLRKNNLRIVKNFGSFYKIDLFE